MSAVSDSSDPSSRSTVTIHLQKIPLLAGLAPESLAKVAAALQLRKIERGQHVIQKGSAGDHLLFLISGRLQAVDLTADGREIGLNFLNDGDYFGELSIIDGLPRSASVIATENSVVALLSRDHALALIYQNPLIAERLLRRMAANIRLAATYRTIIGIPNAFQRVFALLSQFAAIAPGGLVVIDKMPTQQEIAITVNTSRETVSRAIQILIQTGIVEKDLRRLIIRQPEALRHAVNNALVADA
jgi:CRP/FNR family transcriptional regulator, cyclic AMP receptor protein